MIRADDIQNADEIANRLPRPRYQTATNDSNPVACISDMFVYRFPVTLAAKIIIL